MNFTYLLGAGASAQVIPTVKEFPKALEEFADYIFRRLDITLLVKKNDATYKENFLRDLYYVIDEAKKHASIDTFAKKLFLTEQFGELLKLKAIIDAFLTAYQMTNELDKRYDAFLATLLFNENSKLKLPSNINVLSWNYDFQFELSLSNFLMIRDVTKLENHFKIIPNTQLDYSDSSDFCIIKINGTAAGLVNNEVFQRKNFLYLKDNSDIRESVPDKEGYKIDICLKVIRNYHAVLNDNKNRVPSIMFSWENNIMVQNVREFALKKTQATDILVVIGYSFPTFNRIIDKALLLNMQNLSRIIIQGLPEDINAINYRVSALLNNKRHIKIEPVLSKDEFFIPFEM